MALDKISKNNSITNIRQSESSPHAKTRKPDRAEERAHKIGGDVLKTVPKNQENPSAAKRHSLIKIFLPFKSMCFSSPDEPLVAEEKEINKMLGCLEQNKHLTKKQKRAASFYFDKFLSDFMQEKLNMAEKQDGIKKYISVADANTISQSLKRVPLEEQQNPILLSFLDLITEKEKGVAVIKDLIDHLDNQQSLELTKLALSGDLEKIALKGAAAEQTFLREDTTASRLACAFQAKLMSEHCYEQLSGIMKDLPAKEYRISKNSNLGYLNEIDKEWFIQQEQKRLLQDISNIFQKLHLLSQKNFPNELKELNSFLKKAAQTQFGKGELFASQLFFLRFLNPLLTGGQKLEGLEPMIGQIKSGIMIAKVLQNIANQVPLGDKEPHMKFIQDFLDLHHTQQLIREITHNISNLNSIDIQYEY